MNEQVGNTIGAIGKVISNSAELSKDLLQPVCSETGKVIGRLPRVVNAAFAGIDCWCINRETKVKKAQILAAKKLQKVEDSNIVEPDEHILVPLIQSLLYSMDCDELREMYANLLSNAMIKDKKDKVHPAFVETIRQMSPIDAVNLSMFKKIDIVAAVEPLAEYKDKSGLPLYKTISGPIFMNDGNTINLKSIEEQSVSISLLCRLGLITHENNHTVADSSHYDTKLINDLKELLEHYLKNTSLDSDSAKINIKKSLFQITMFGKLFLDICL